MSKISNELLTASKEASEKYGIPQSVILSFAGNETSFGTTGMGKSKNNLFGIGNKSYDSVTDSVEDFAKLVTGNKSSAQSQKYGEAVSGASTPEEWVTAITEAGYNSVNQNYVSDTMGVYKSYNLSQYDGVSSSGSSSSGTSETYDLKWWGDIVIVVLSIILVVVGVVFLSLAVTNNSITEVMKDPTKIIKKAVKK